MGLLPLAEILIVVEASNIRGRLIEMPAGVLRSCRLVLLLLWSTSAAGETRTLCIVKISHNI